MMSRGGASLVINFMCGLTMSGLWCHEDESGIAILLRILHLHEYLHLRNVNRFRHQGSVQLKPMEFPIAQCGKLYLVVLVEEPVGLLDVDPPFWRESIHSDLAERLRCRRVLLAALLSKVAEQRDVALSSTHG